MKFFIIHGSHSSSKENWFPWLNQKLSELGQEVIIPDFPTPKGQNLNNWLAEFKKYESRIDEDTVFIGHSIGVAFILSVIEKLNIKIKASYFVAGFIEPLNSEFDKVNSTFIEKDFNISKIKQNCKKFVCYQSDNDPYVPVETGEKLAKKIGAELITIENGGHLNSEYGFGNFEQLFKKIQSDLRIDKVELIEEFWKRKWELLKTKEINLDEPNEFAKTALVEIKKNKLKKVLEIGCGVGKDAIYFAKNKLDVTATDFDKQPLEIIENKIKKDKIKNLEIKVLNHAKELDTLPRETYDVVYSHLSLQYFKNSKTTKIFDDIYYLLKPKGLLIFKIKSTDDQLYGKGKLIEKDMFYLQHIRHFFSKDYIKEKTNKFKIISIKKVNEKSFTGTYISSNFEVIAQKPVPTKKQFG